MSRHSSHDETVEPTPDQTPEAKYECAVDCVAAAITKLCAAGLGGCDAGSVAVALYRDCNGIKTEAK